MNNQLRILLIIIVSIFLLGVKRSTLNMTEQQLRNKQIRIQEIILLSQQTNKQPKPIGDDLTAIKSDEDLEELPEGDQLSGSASFDETPPRRRRKAPARKKTDPVSDAAE